MTLPFWKRALCKESGWVDLEFYQKHSEELDFPAMVAVAICGVLTTFIGISVAFTFDAMGGIITMFLGVIIFASVKMYLHVRKDAIEIKELFKQ